MKRKGLLEAFGGFGIEDGNHDSAILRENANMRPAEVQQLHSTKEKGKANENQEGQIKPPSLSSCCRHGLSLQPGKRGGPLWEVDPVPVPKEQLGGLKVRLAPRQKPFEAADGPARKGDVVPRLVEVVDILTQLLIKFNHRLWQPAP